METEYNFIVNPKARSGRGEMVWNTLEPELKKRRTVYRVYMTEKRGHAEKIAEQITADGEEHILVVLGGDGTVNETVNGIKEPGKITLGYIPIGSGNDFARGLGISADPSKAAGAVLHPRKIINMDIGQIRKGNTSGQNLDPAEEGENKYRTARETGNRAERPRRFAVSSGMGFDAAVCHEVCVSRWKEFLNKLGMGKLCYTAVALDRLRKDRPTRMKITFPDGSGRVFEKTYFSAFMNLKFEGGGFQFCPEASAEDGMLDIIVVHGLSPLKILFLLPWAFVGKHVGFRGITILRCRGCAVETELPMPLHTDGEPGFLRRNAEVSIMKEKLKVIIG